MNLEEPIINDDANIAIDILMNPANFLGEQQFVEMVVDIQNNKLNEV